MKPYLFVLLGAHLNELNIQRCGLPQLRSCFTVVTLDCRNYLDRSFDKSDEMKAIDTQRWMEYSVIHEIDNFNEFTQIFLRYKPLYVIDFAGPGERVRKIQKFVQSHNSKFVVHELGKFPQLPPHQRLKRLFGVVEQNRTIRPLNSVQLTKLNDVPRKKNLYIWKLIKVIFQTRYPVRPDVAIVAGNRAIRYEVKRSKKILFCNSLDAHAFKSVEISGDSQIEALSEGNYDVFIDDCMTASPTGTMLNWNLVQPQTYFPLLNKYFSLRECATGRKIVICGHPNSRYMSQYQDNFEGRKFYMDSTQEIVRLSHTVLSHGSTSISFAVLGNKPIVFLTSTEIAKSVFGPNIKMLSRQLGSPLISIDTNGIADPTNPLLSLRKQSKFKSNFLEFESIDLSNPWDKFVEWTKKSIVNSNN